MKDKRPIAVQVAELTEEQKDNIVSAYKIKIIPAVIVVWITVILIAPLSLGLNYWSARSSELFDEYMLACDIYVSKAGNIEFTDFSHPKVIEAKEEYDAANRKADLFMYMSLAASPFAASGFIFGTVNLVTVYKKYPYFSEKKYSYIVKERKKRSV